MDFKNYLMKELSYFEFIELSATLGISLNRCTRILKNPGTMTRPDITAIAKMVQKTPGELVHGFGCGKETITVTDMETLTAMI
jgi:hypothetical protein